MLKISKVVSSVNHFVTYIQTNALWGKLLTNSLCSCTDEKNNGKTLNYKNVGAEGESREREAVLRKGERKQTHTSSFSKSTKLPSKILPWYGPADYLHTCQKIS